MSAIVRIQFNRCFPTQSDLKPILVDTHPLEMTGMNLYHKWPGREIRTKSIFLSECNKLLLPFSRLSYEYKLSSWIRHNFNGGAFPGNQKGKEVADIIFYVGQAIRSSFLNTFSHV